MEEIEHIQIVKDITFLYRLEAAVYTLQKLSQSAVVLSTSHLAYCLKMPVYLPHLKNSFVKTAD